MQAPSHPIDINIICGQQHQHSQNLLRFNSSISRGIQQIKQIAKQKALPWKQDKNNFILSFDFYVEQGKQQQAVEYFHEGIKKKGDKTLSPLQRVFRFDNREDQRIYKIEPHQGYVRVLYEISNDQYRQHDRDYDDFMKAIQSFENSEIDPTSQMSLDIKGSVSHNKKNRQNVKVDYSHFQFIGSKFLSPELISYMISIGQFQGEQLMYMTPYLDMFKKAQKAKINLKLESVRNIQKYYNSVAYPNEKNQSETKAFPYVNKGIFRQRVQMNFIIKDYVAQVDLMYESEDVFIRLIKVYGKVINKIFDSSYIYK